jgi:hypothetical protein
MANVGYATLGIIPSAKGMGSAISKQVDGPAGKAGDRAGKTMGGRMKTGLLAPLKGIAGPLAAALGGAAVFSFFKSAVSGASDLSESASKVQVVFGSASKSIFETGKTAATSMGLSEAAYLGATGTLGNLLVSLGTAPGKAAAMSKEMVKLAGDLASFNNVSPEEALQALTSGLSGEAEPLKKFGVNMNDVTLKAQAMKMGLIKTTKDALTPQNKALAAQALIMAQTKTAQGDFARTSGGLANQQRIAAAGVADLKAKIGASLLPTITKMTAIFAGKVVPAISGFVTGMQEGTGAGGKFVTLLKGIGTGVLTLGTGLASAAKFIKENATSFIVLGSGIALVSAATAAHSLVLAINSGALKAWFIQTKVVQGALKAWAATQWLLNVAMSANPIGIVVIAIAALVAGVIYAYKHSEKFRTILTKAFNAVKTAGGALVGWFKALPGTILRAIGYAQNYLLTKGRDLIVGLAKGIYGAAKSLITWWVQLPSRILGFLGNAGATLVGKGAGFIAGLAKGVYNGAKSLLSWWGGLQFKILGMVGNVASTLYSKGLNLITGLARGVYANAAALLSWFRTLPGKALTALGNVSSRLYSAGQDLLQGMINGVKSMASRLIGSVTQPISDAIGKAKNLLGINSPSRVFAGFGRNTGLGFVQGVKGTLGLVRGAAAGLVAAATPPGLPSATRPGERPPSPLDGLAAAVGGSGVRDITVIGADDPASTARQVGRELANRGV